VTRVIGIDQSAGVEHTVVVIGETLPGGALQIIEVDDVVNIRRWGRAYILEMETRDPVLVRPDGTCVPLVTGVA
jgi:hypothetical protein